MLWRKQLDGGQKDDFIDAMKKYGRMYPMRITVPGLTSIMTDNRGALQ